MKNSNIKKDIKPTGIFRRMAMDGSISAILFKSKEKASDPMIHYLSKITHKKNA